MTGARIELYRARNKEWGFRVIAPNGRKVLTAGETFKGSSAKARRAIGAALKLAEVLCAHDRVVVVK